MHASRIGLRTLAVGTAAFALVAVAAGGTLAASTNPPTLYACYNTSGQVAMSDLNTCKLTGGGRLVSWSTVPQPGPTGPQGATGATGPKGAQGASGSGATTHLVKFAAPTTRVTVFDGAEFSVDLYCDKSQPTPLMGRYIVTKSGKTATFTEQRTNAVSVTSENLGSNSSSGSAWTLTVVQPGDELWVAGDTETFHMSMTVAQYAGDGSCQLFATY